MGNLSNWIRGDPCTSRWTGVLCFNETLIDGYLHAQELQLMNLSLSGILVPEIGSLAYMERLNFMWNKIIGSIPKEIGNTKSLVLLLLNGNLLTGSPPDELGFLPNLGRIQIDQDHISGPLPASFANLNNTSNNIQDLFAFLSEIANAAEHPHLSIPETGFVRKRKQQQQLLRSFVFALAGAAMEFAGLTVRHARANKNSS
ncbi:hypothetical protein KIW84_022451 [Lathyrus oleraceus]|uniref:Leucine-rich repeat-containing N-terminal plant-type domain-containing protein n=1 Tax=Pisum sativum TaxID=3888 RepID=A0A9D4YGC0_PEA|nr:hypothetical protein KIW84_022451 [Pisum sativum]